MKRFSIPLGLALATLSLLAASTPVHAGPRGIQAEGQGFLDANGFSAGLVGPGKGEHLGGCTLIVYLNWGELYYGGNLDTVYLEIYAANGDHLSAAVDSEFDPETGIVTATITFAGGSGRFADASGSALLRIVPDTYWFDYGQPIDGTRFSWALDGTINY